MSTKICVHQILTKEGKVQCMIRESDRVCELCGKKMRTYLLSKEEVKNIANQYRELLELAKDKMLAEENKTGGGVK